MTAAAVPRAVRHLFRHHGNFFTTFFFATTLPTRKSYLLDVHLTRILAMDQRLRWAWGRPVARPMWGVFA